MDDLVKRLRGSDDLTDQQITFACTEAADEIERLRRRSDQVVAPTQAQIEAALKAFMECEGSDGDRAMAAALTAAAEVGVGEKRHPAYAYAMEAKIEEIEEATIERCAQVAEDWFTLAPKYRTKENLLARIRALKDIKE